MRPGASPAVAKAAKGNAGSASAVCLLTAQSLREKLGGNIPVGAVNSCVGGTPVEPWTPPDGSLYVAHIKPLLPMRFAAALWDQGERDEKTTNTTCAQPPALHRPRRSLTALLPRAGGMRVSFRG